MFYGDKKHFETRCYCPFVLFPPNILYFDTEHLLLTLCFPLFIIHVVITLEYLDYSLVKMAYVLVFLVHSIFDILMNIINMLSICIITLDICYLNIVRCDALFCEKRPHVTVPARVF